MKVCLGTSMAQGHCTPAKYQKLVPPFDYSPLRKWPWVDIIGLVEASKIATAYHQEHNLPGIVFNCFGGGEDHYAFTDDSTWYMEVDVHTGVVKLYYLNGGEQNALY